LCMSVFMKSTPDSCLILPKAGMNPTNFCTAPQYHDIKIHLALSVSLKLDRHAKLTSAFSWFLVANEPKTRQVNGKLCYSTGSQVNKLVSARPCCGICMLPFMKALNCCYPGATLNLKQGSAYCTYCHLIHLANILLS